MFQELGVSGQVWKICDRTSVWECRHLLRRPGFVGFKIPGAPSPSDLASESTKAFFRAIAKFGNGSIGYPGMKYGYTHKSGVLVIPARFEGGGIFSEGLAAVQLKGKCGYIDKAGHLVIPAIFDSAHPFSGGLAEVGIGEQWAYIDKSRTYVWKAP
jgi:WG containing repeat